MPKGLAFIGLPQTILFQLLFALVSPIIDLALIVNIISTATSIHEHGYTAVKGDLQHVAFFWLLFAAIDLTAGLIAMALERRENWSLMTWLIPQRFGYRQVMYYVVIKAFVQAVRGPRVGWSTVARSGEVRVGTDSDTPARRQLAERILALLSWGTILVMVLAWAATFANRFLRLGWGLDPRLIWAAPIVVVLVVVVRRLMRIRFGARRGKAI